jgi:hypothetical protein
MSQNSHLYYVGVQFTAFCVRQLKSLPFSRAGSLSDKHTYIHETATERRAAARLPFSSPTAAGLPEDDATAGSA